MSVKSRRRTSPSFTNWSSASRAFLRRSPSLLASESAVSLQLGSFRRKSRTVRWSTWFDLAQIILFSSHDRGDERQQQHHQHRHGCVRHSDDRLGELQPIVRAANHASVTSGRGFVSARSRGQLNQSDGRIYVLRIGEVPGFHRGLLIKVVRRLVLSSDQLAESIQEAEIGLERQFTRTVARGEDDLGDPEPASGLDILPHLS